MQFYSSLYISMYSLNSFEAVKPWFGLKDALKDLT